jgi:manganese/zinc/iron transport system permease protein
MDLLEKWSWVLDGWIVAAGVLSAVAAALLGNFLVLRRMSMLGDAISHAVLPGLAAAFLLSGSRNSLPMFLGAVVVGVLTAFFTEWIRGVGKVDEGASMGVVFTSLFALGLVMIVQAADHVDLDPGCVLYGAIELIPFSPDTVGVGPLQVPRPVAILGVVTVINAAFVLVFFKELKLSSFDPALATTSGFNAKLMHYMLMVLVAVTAVASFESVGNILVVAMFVVPPATAYMLTDRLPVMIGLSVVLAALSAVLGHIGAITVPAWFGFDSTRTTGMMAVATGLLLLLAVALAPRHGVLVKFVRHRLLSLRILADDVVAQLFRIEERDEVTETSAENLRDLLLADRPSFSFVLRWLRFRRQLVHSEQGYRLTAAGQGRGRELVRSHRLWEQYLVSEAGLEADQIHDKAEQFEHFTDPEMREQLDTATHSPRRDPHGRPIPQEREK